MIKHIPLFLTLALATILALPTSAQTSMPAPAGWKTQTRDNGSTTFTPPDLKAGEIYSVTVYDVAALGGKSLGAYLRAFAGPVGAKPGQLNAPLKIKAESAQLTTGIGFYNGPNGTSLAALFYVISSDGATVHVKRTLVNGEGELLTRYQSTDEALFGALAKRAAPDAPTKDAPGQDASTVGTGRLAKLGGPITPGIYAGNQYNDGNLKYRLRVYLYANGEYRIRDENDGGFRGKYGGGDSGAGSYQYDSESGHLNIEKIFSLSNDIANSLCFYGRNRAGQPAIYAESSPIWSTTHTALTLVAPLAPSDSPSVVQANTQAREKAKLAKEAALERERQAKSNAIKTVVAPGKGVPDAQIAAMLHNRDSTTMPSVIGSPAYFSPGINIPGHPEDFQAGQWVQPPVTFGSFGSTTDEAYLLLRDGTAFRGLLSAPDQFDVAASRRKDPKSWGKWKRVGGKIQLSFEGKAFEPLPEEDLTQKFREVAPNAPGARLNGHYTAFDSEISLDITFTSSGRFKRRALDAERDFSAPFTLTKANKTVAGGDTAGTYSVDRYSLTLRYDDGRVERTPFFVLSPKAETVWFEGHQIGQYDALYKAQKAQTNR